MVQARRSQLAPAAAFSLLLLSTAINDGVTTCRAFTTPAAPPARASNRRFLHRGRPAAIEFESSTTTTALFGKKRKGGTPGPNKNYGKKAKGGGQPQQEKASVQEARFDAATRQFMFTLVGLTKTLPDKSKDILKNINLSFYPGAKIGVVGLNGSGKVSVE